MSELGKSCGWCLCDAVFREEYKESLKWQSAYRWIVCIIYKHSVIPSRLDAVGFTAETRLLTRCGGIGSGAPCFGSNRSGRGSVQGIGLEAAV